ncbi:MFS transporter, MHS family, proline/betaine transporter [Marinobacter antarcticus]|uniref:MFS transporter, MHS family, proline/betaine transporter n=1 Tax=Marinobacter antarcticus TaxID=564117 RepID=A0A1M6PBK8_9GAMM|nr:MFS transporter [Marinobacter antarcticus]SHK05307.1 MFS transporter, MHS family, proline/betaine transporter [Marinobacter antarcticus]
MSRNARAPRPPTLRHKIMAGFIGNVVEWYDFAVYGYLAGVIAPVFFPSGNPTAALLATYGIFAAGFIMRPLGAAVFGWFGDRYGRARTMQISVTMMALPTLLLGMLPSYEQAGLLAPALLVLVRLLQGLSVGGEFSSSATYLVETAPKGKRGLTGSWANIGAILGIAAISIRRNLHNSERFKKHHEGREETSPLLQAFTTNRRETLLALVFASSYGTCYYIAFVYLPEWLSAQDLMSRGTALLINTGMMVLVIPAMPLFAIVGDRWLRRRSWIALSLMLLSIIAWPLHVWMLDSGGSLTAVIVAHSLVFLLLAVPLGSGPALFVELFPESDRLSGYSVAFNLGMGVFGGLTPMIATSLIAITGLLTAPAMYLAITSFIAVLALMLMPDRSREPLR